MTGTQIDIRLLKKHLRHFQGGMTAVFASTADPCKTHVVKGDKPLCVKYNRRLDAMLYASLGQHLKEALGGGRGWEPVEIPSMTIATIDRRHLDRIALEPFTFDRR